MATKDFSNVQEKLIANYLGWKTVSGSGARDFNPGDVESDDWIGECKTHVNETDLIVFHKNVWDKICLEARSKFKYPVLFVDNGTQRIECTWAMINLDLFALDNYELLQSSIVKQQVNIRFSHIELYNYLRDYSCSVTGKINIVSCSFGDSLLGIFPISCFKEIVD